MTQDKIFSTRMDENVIRFINALARDLRISKKAVIERAILFFAKTQKETSKIDPFEETCGSWIHEAAPSEEINTIRKTFRESMTRYHK